MTRIELKMIQLKALSGACLLIFSFVYLLNFFNNAGVETDQKISRERRRKGPQFILTPKPKRPQPTLAPNKSLFVMLEARHISDRLGLVFWTLINSAYLELTRNWLCQTSAMPGVHERVFIITTDEETASKLRTDWPEIRVLSMRSTQFNESLTWGQEEYNDFLILRASFIRLFVDSDVSFVLFETDSIWLRNPLEYFQNYSRSADVMIPEKYRSDAYGRNLTFSPMLVVPNQRSKSFFSQMYFRLINPKFSNKILYDQDIIDDLCKEEYGDAECRVFPWEEIADGYWFKLSDKKKEKLLTYIINNNFYSGVKNKITRQALNGFWFLTGRECNFEKARSLLK